MNMPSSTPPASGIRSRGLATALLAMTLYIVITLACLRLSWLVPGHGLEIILIRLVLATMIPGCLVVVFSPMLYRKRLHALHNGLVYGMFCIVLVYLVAAVAVGMKFRL